MILSKYTLDQILDLKFGKNDKYRLGQTVKQWIEGENKPLISKDKDEPALQLKNYITSVEVKKKLKDEGFLL